VSSGLLRRVALVRTQKTPFFTANVVSSSLILLALMMEAISYS
jgi:hypothetical protein